MRIEKTRSGVTFKKKKDFLHESKKEIFRNGQTFSLKWFEKTDMSVKIILANLDGDVRTQIKLQHILCKTGGERK